MYLSNHLYYNLTLASATLRLHRLVYFSVNAVDICQALPDDREKEFFFRQHFLPLWTLSLEEILLDGIPPLVR